MKNLAFAVILLLFNVAAQVDAQLVAPGQADDWWARAPLARSKYYAVKTDLPKEDAIALAKHMDATFDGYMALFSKLPVRVHRPSSLDLYLFLNERDYLSTLRVRFAVDATGSWGTCIARGDKISLAGWQGDHTTEQMKRLLQHEGFHQIVRLLFRGLPRWADEGLAEMFERGILVGGRLTLGEFTECDKNDLIAAAQADGIIPFARFFAISKDQWSAQVRTGDPKMVYLQAWSMVHFFVFSENGKYEKNFMSFLVQLNRKIDWKVAFINSFGAPVFDAMEQKWLAYVRNIPPTDYRETVRRLDFLAAGMTELRKQDVAPASLDELKAALKKISFEHTSDLFGERRSMSALADDVFTVPYAVADKGRDFVLVDARGRIPNSRRVGRNPAPLNIVATGLGPQMFVATWTKKGRELNYTIVAKPPVAIPKAPSRVRPSARNKPEPPREPNIMGNSGNAGDTIHN
jgi:hypothetical protein